MNPSIEFSDNGDAQGSNATLDAPISSQGWPVLGQLYTVPARQGRAIRLRAGQTVRIINTHGTQVCDTWAFSAVQLNEFLSMEHVRAWLDRTTPRVGDVLVTNRRRPILTLTADTSPGVHDTLIAPCDLDRYRTLGVSGYHDNCADNLRMALAAIGIRTGEVPCALNLWMNVPIKANGDIEWLTAASTAGDHIDHRAEIDCIVVMSACPQDIIAINSHAPCSIHFIVEVNA